jgi:hypothetical protein
LELNYEQQKHQEILPSEKKNYWSRINTTFLRSVASSGCSEAVEAKII